MQVVKMLVVVVTVFAICWLPLHAFILLIDFRPDLTEYETISQKNFFVVVYSVVHWLAMSNSCVNPFIYGFLHDSFRVLSTFCLLSICLKLLRFFSISSDSVCWTFHPDSSPPPRTFPLPCSGRENLV